MKSYVLSGAAADTHKPVNPERTARRQAVGYGMNFDVRFQEWTSRAAMARTIRMQQQRERRTTDWRPCIALGDGEGY